MISGWFTFVAGDDSGPLFSEQNLTAANQSASKELRGKRETLFGLSGEEVTADTAVTQDAFQEIDDVQLLSHSVTPTVDTVRVLKQYAKKHGVLSSKWSLVTGKKEQIYQLGRSAYFIEEDLGDPRGADDFLHTENFVLVDKQRHIRGVYNGLNKASVRQLIADIKALRAQGPVATAKEKR